MDEERAGTPSDETNSGQEQPEATDEEPTNVLPPEDDTAVLPGGEPTRVMPVAPPPVPPTPPPLTPAPPPPLSGMPTVTMTRAKPDRRLWWIVLLLAVLAALAVTMFLTFRPREANSPGQDFIGTWMPADASAGGLVIKQNGDAFVVTAYDAQVQPMASEAATLQDGELNLRLPSSALGASGGALDVTISYISAQDSLHAVGQGGGGTRVDRDFVRTDVLQPAAAAPAPAPTPTPTPTPTLSPSPTISGSPSGTADQMIIAGVTKIQGGVTAWATNSNGVYPAATEVSSTGGIAQNVNPWPVNPYTNQPMKAGTAPGDYTYEQLDGGQGYKLTAYLGNNLTYNLP